MATDRLADIFPGDSEMARVMRSHDWSATPLGDPAGWPDALKIPLRMLLTSRFEMWLGWGPDLLFFYNDAYVPTLGRKHPRMLGRPFREVWAEVYDDVADQVARVRAGQATWNKALMLLLERNGYPEETYHSFSYSPLYGDGDGSPVEGLLCIVSEETERVITERRVDMLRRLGMSLVGASDEGAVREAVRSVLRTSRRDFPFALLYLHGEGQACTEDAAPLLAREWLAPAWRAGARAGGPDPAQLPSQGLKITLPQGISPPGGDWQVPPVEALLVPIGGAAGQPAAGAMVLGLNPHRRGDDAAVSDIARLLAGQVSGALANAEALQSERRRADRIWTHARDLIVVADADGVFRSISPAWTRILGHAVEDVVGRHHADFIWPDDLQASLHAFAEAQGSGELTGFENRMKTLDGGFRWISWHTAKEQGLVYAYGRDVTEQKHNVAALAEAEEALRHAQKMEAVGQLTGGIAHDFNNLLTGIIGSLEIVQRRIARQRYDDVGFFANAATESANRAASLTQRLLAFSRRQALAPRIVDVDALLAGISDLLRRTIGEAVALDLAPAPGLWRTRCDPNQLESALLNLVINARDAMPGGGRLRIATANARIGAVGDIAWPGASATLLRPVPAAEAGDTGPGAVGLEATGLRDTGPAGTGGGEAAPGMPRSAGDYVVVSVEDEGHGMSAETARKAFDPFFTTKPLGQGTGLGLSMVYGFAQQSGGFVEIDSEEGRGTIVRLCLPRSDDAMPDAAPADAAVRAERPRRGETILVVEDEAAVRAIVVATLTDAGYATIEAGDAAEGLHHLRGEARIDLLLTDVGLPGGLNGRQLADAAHALRPNLKVMLMTGYVHDGPQAASLLAPGMELVTKPFTAESLAARVQSMLDR